MHVEWFRQWFDERTFLCYLLPVQIVQTAILFSCTVSAMISSESNTQFFKFSTKIKEFCLSKHLRREVRSFDCSCSFKWSQNKKHFFFMKFSNKQTKLNLKDLHKKKTIFIVKLAIKKQKRILFIFILFFCFSFKSLIHAWKIHDFQTMEQIKLK